MRQMTMDAPFRPPLPQGRFDVVVIGGGINGVAVARLCARAGRRTLLVERNDFASGTTSRSTRIIHGGLRYLEQGEIQMVRESLRERERLLRERPHLVRPLEFVVAMPPGSGLRSALAVRAGIWLYSALAGRRKSLTKRADLRQLERQLDKSQAWGLFRFEDAQCEFPERLVAEWLNEARDFAACVRNHTEVLAVSTSAGRVTGVVIRDAFTGSEQTVAANWIVNATGPWADEICAISSIETPTMIGGVRGSHLVLRRFPGAPEHAVYAEATDGRPIFLIPWNDLLLLGTTELRDDNPSDTAARPFELEYLMQSLHRLFPHAPTNWQDALYSFSGVRPLPYSPSQPSASITRRHLLHDHAPEGAAGMISIIGGKLTTAAGVARDCARQMGIKVAEPLLARAPMAELSVLEQKLTRWAMGIAQMAQIGEESARVMAEWYCRRTLAVLRPAHSDPQLREHLCPHTPHLVAEAVYAVRYEHACTLADILLRRVPVALGGCWSWECTHMAARKIGASLGWTSTRLARELESFEEERAAFLHPVSRAGEAAPAQRLG